MHDARWMIGASRSLSRVGLILISLLVLCHAYRFAMQRVATIARSGRADLSRAVTATPRSFVRLNSSVSPAHASSARPVGPPPPPPYTRVQASVKLYTSHILVASNVPAQDWQSRLETKPLDPDEPAPVDSLSQFAFISAPPQHLPLSANKSDPPPTVTMLDVSPEAGGSGDLRDGDMLLLTGSESPVLMHHPSPVPSISVWPARPQADRQTVAVQDLASNRSVELASRPQLSWLMQLRGLDASAAAAPSAVSSAPYELLALVCCHTQRDIRCGQRGPPIVQAIQQWNDAAAAAASAAAAAAAPPHLRVYPCSHVGGHEYAGNLLLYAWRRNDAASAGASSPPLLLSDWFGLVTPELVPTIFDAYAQFSRAATQADATPQGVMQLRQQMLAGAMPAGMAAAGCSHCDVANAASPPPSHLVHLWRGGMGVEKLAARQMLAQVQATLQR